MCPPFFMRRLSNGLTLLLGSGGGGSPRNQLFSILPIYFSYNSPVLEKFKDYKLCVDSSKILNIFCTLFLAYRNNLLC